MSSAEADQDRIAANVAQWTRTNRDFTDGDAERQWRDPQVYWGEFEVPDAWLGDDGEIETRRAAYVTYLSERLHGPRTWLREAMDARRAR